MTLPETIWLICVCSEEWCWCVNPVEAPLSADQYPPDIACAECESGHHVWTMGGPRT